MNAATSLENSAQLFLSIGDELSAAFCKRMANDARNLGSVGDALYKHWASAQAQRAAVKMKEYEERKVA